MLNFTPHFAKNAQYDLKTRSYENIAQCNCALLATALSYVTRFQQKRGMIKNFGYLDEFEKDFENVGWLYCVWHLLIIE
jgi:uncharacterized protein (UPF0297 family)